MTKSLLPLILAPLALVACVEIPPAETRPVVPAPENDTCKAASLAHLIGQDAAALATLGNRRDPLRVIRPGQPVTMDFIQTRANIELDENDRIIRLTCG